MGERTSNKMKKKISVSIDEGAIAELEKLLNLADGSFRNKSHIIEFALMKFIKGEEVGK